MPSGIGSWSRRENSGRFVGSRPREERRGPVSGQPKHRMRWITLEVEFEGALWPSLSGHTAISSFHPKWAMLVNTTVWRKTDSVGPTSFGWRAFRPELPRTGFWGPAYRGC